VTTNAAVDAYDSKFAFDMKYRAEVDDVHAEVAGVSLPLIAMVSVTSVA
jgi:hypothetical protein